MTSTRALWRRHYGARPDRMMNTHACRSRVAPAAHRLFSPPPSEKPLDHTPTPRHSPPDMNLLWAALVIVIVAAVAVAAMLLVRRRAPDGSYFVDGDRAAGVFGV